MTTRTHEQLRECVDVFHATLADGIEMVLKEDRAYLAFTGLKVFTEFVGPSSVAHASVTFVPKSSSF